MQRRELQKEDELRSSVFLRLLGRAIVEDRLGDVILEAQARLRQEAGEPGPYRPGQAFASIPSLVGKEYEVRVIIYLTDAMGEPCRKPSNGSSR